MRARLEADANSTYKLDVLDRDVVGMLQLLGLWSNRAIGRAYGIDCSIVARHGKRVAQRLGQTS